MGFLQNHDQIGNRALGERIAALAAPEAVRAATAVLLLSPALPLLFMGEEWGAPEPFLFFSDLGPDLGPARGRGPAPRVRALPRVREPGDARAHPGSAGRDHARALGARLEPPRRARATGPGSTSTARCCALRAEAIAPLLAGEPVPAASWKALGDTALEVAWAFPAGTLRLVANLGATAVPHPGPGPGLGPPPPRARPAGAGWRELPPWSVAFYLAGPSR